MLPYSQPVFNPTNLYSGQVWYDATQQDIGALPSWTDQFGSGNAAVQGNVGAQPVNTASAINGTNALSYNGLNSVLVPPAAVGNAITMSTSHTIFLVFKSLDNISTPRVLLNAGKGGAGSDMLSISIISSVLAVGYYNGSSYMAASTAFSDTSNAHILSISHAANSLPICKLDNTAMLGNANPQGDLIDGCTLGSELDAVKYFKGYFGEIIIYGRVLSAVEIASITRYLSQKRSVAIS